MKLVVPLREASVPGVIGMKVVRLRAGDDGGREAGVEGGGRGGAEEGGEGDGED